MALQLCDGAIVTGKNSALMTAAAGAILNAIKYFSNMDDDLLLISPVVLEPILKLKKEIFKLKNPVLNLEEILLALSICAATNPMAEKALSNLGLLQNAEAHSTVIISSGDETIFKKLGINLTCEPEFPTKDLYQL